MELLTIARQLNMWYRRKLIEEQKGCQNRVLEQFECFLSFALLNFCLVAKSDIFSTRRKGRSFHLMCKYANADLETISRGFNIFRWTNMTMKMQYNSWLVGSKKNKTTTTRYEGMAILKLCLMHHWSIVGRLGSPRSEV